MFTKPSIKEYVIFSPMEGKIVKDEQPLSNAKIIRKLRWNGNEEGQISEFYTDESGFFSIPIHKETLSLGMLDQFVAKAELKVEHDSTTHHFWYSNKVSPELYAETEGPLDGLVCDLSSEDFAVPMSPTAIITKCRWNGMPE